MYSKNMCFIVSSHEGQNEHRGFFCFGKGKKHIIYIKYVIKCFLLSITLKAIDSAYPWLYINFLPIKIFIWKNFTEIFL